MYALQKIDPDKWEQIPQLSGFYNDLPNKPYCSDSKDYCKVRPKAIASKHAYIQPNHPNIIKWLVIDIDSPLKHTSKKPYYDVNLFLRYYDKHLATPTFIALNRTNGHVQYFYKLAEPVTMFGGSNEHPIRYLRAIQYALNVQLGGDMQFGGSLAKNPLDSKTWDIYLTGASSHSLDDLTTGIDLKDPINKPPKKSSNDDKISPFAGLGRNCDTFDYLRFLAYPIAHTMTQTALYNHLMTLGKEFNSRFKQPMLLSEIRAICRSIAKFCKTSPKYIAYSKRFSEKQAIKGRNGGLKSDSSKGGIARSATYETKRKQAEQMHHHGVKIKDIAEQLQVTRRTLSNWGIKANKDKQISDKK